jgi:hypothetical protein
MIRLILFAILFYLIFRVVRKLMLFFSPPKSEVQGKPSKEIKSFDPEDIEDIDYQEVEKKNEE